MVLMSASAGWRESSRVCWTMTGMSARMTLAKSVPRGISSGGI
jgi:hypothetical protein